MMGAYNVELPYSGLFSVGKDFRQLSSEAVSDENNSDKKKYPTNKHCSFNNPCMTKIILTKTCGCSTPRCRNNLLYGM